MTIPTPKLIEASSVSNITRNLLISWRVSAEFIQLLQTIEMFPEVAMLNEELTRKISDCLIYFEYKSAALATPLHQNGIDVILAALAKYYAKFKIMRNENVALDDPNILDLASERVFPLVKNLGAWQVKRELEDLLFSLADPTRYYETLHWFMKLKANNSRYWNNILVEVGGKCREVDGASSVKETYCGVQGAYRRLLSQGGDQRKIRPQSFVKINVIMPTVEGCYLALEKIHQMGIPEPGSFRDLIAIPENNGYGALLTNICFYSDTKKSREEFDVTEVVIQTPLMAEIANQGVTQQECYSAIKYGFTPAKFGAEVRCIRQLVTAFSQLETEENSRLLVFTADKKVRQLSQGATVLDLAYDIHTKLGHQAVSAEVNGNIVDLFYKLKSHDFVRIIRTENNELARTEKDLEYVVQAKSRNRIKKLLYRQPITKGRILLEEYLRQRGIDMTGDILDENVSQISNIFHLLTPTQVYSALANSTTESGKGGITIGKVGGEIVRLKRLKIPDLRTGLNNDPSMAWMPVLKETINGGDSLPMRVCSYCRPTPSNEIVGVKTRRHISVHTNECHKARPYQKIKLNWSRIARMVRAMIRIDATDRPNLVNNITEVVMQRGSGLDEIHAKALTFGQAYVEITIYARDAVELVSCMADLQNIRSVKKVRLQSTSLPVNIKMKIQEQSLDKNLMAELEGMGYGKPGVKIIIESSSTKQRYGNIHINYAEHKPTFSPDVFFGRSEEVLWLQNHTVKSKGGLALLSGLKRIGKTSLCYRFRDNILPQDIATTWTVRVDLREHRRSSSSTILAAINNSIAQKFKIPPIKRGCSSSDVMKTIEKIVNIGSKHTKNPHLVLVLDEFGGPIDSFEAGTLGPELFDFINMISDQELPLSQILVVPPLARFAMNTLDVWSYLRSMPEKQLSTLSTGSGKEMITQPFTRGGAFFGEGALNKVLFLTGGHPYYIILLLKEIAQRFDRDSRKQFVNEADITHATEQMLRGDAAFRYLWDEVKKIHPPSPLMKVLANFVSISRPYFSESQVVDELTNKNSIGIDDLKKSLRLLVDHQVLRINERSQEENDNYSFTIPLFAHWIQNTKLNFID